MRALRSLATVFLAWVLVGCWTPQHAGDDWIAAVRALSERTGGDAFEPNRGLVRRALPRDDITPQPGDQVLYAIDVESPSSSSRIYLRCTVLESENGESRTSTATITSTWGDGRVESRHYVSAVLPVLVECLDDEGELIGSSVAEDTPIESLERGFTLTAQKYVDDQKSRVDAAILRETTMFDGPAIFAVGQLLQNDETLRGLALDLVDKTLLVSAIWNFGVSLSTEFKFDHTEVVEREPLTGQPGFRFPVELTINGSPALRLAVTVVETDVPHALTAGVVRIDGFRPSDTRFRVRVRWVEPE